MADDPRRYPRRPKRANEFFFAGRICGDRRPPPDPAGGFIIIIYNSYNFGPSRRRWLRGHWRVDFKNRTAARPRHRPDGRAELEGRAELDGVLMRG